MRLGPIRCVHQVVGATPHRNPHHGMADSFQRGDLASHEAVADLGVLIDEVGNPQAESHILAHHGFHRIVGNRRGSDDGRLLNLGHQPLVDHVSSAG